MVGFHEMPSWAMNELFYHIAYNSDNNNINSSP